jgi:hypothetical protein
MFVKEPSVTELQCVCLFVCVAVALALFDPNNWKWAFLFWASSSIISNFTPHIFYVCMGTIKMSGRSECLVDLTSGKNDRGVFLRCCSTI